MTGSRRTCCSSFQPTPVNRREWLRQSASGFGSVALAGLMTGSGQVLADSSVKLPQMTPRAKNVIFLYMDGGPSQVDTFDPKPLLTKENGNPFKMKIQPTQFDNVGSTLGSPWKFENSGESGLPISDLFPQLRSCADELCVIRSMTSEFSEHTNANYFLHTGHGLQGRPSMGAWVTYGLGSENQNLPGFVVVNAGLIPPGGLDCFSNGFLPATFQGSIFRREGAPVANVERSDKTNSLQRRKLQLMETLDRSLLAHTGKQDALESAIANYELAFRMQTAAPELADLSQESKATQEMYGLNDDWPGTKAFGQSCLLARRLVERGVRFVQVTTPGGNGDRWDQHTDLKDGHQKNAHSVDQPITALLKDLRARGLLDETLVVWGGEFGRTPFAQGSNGRDHNPFGYTIWMAGGGVKGGMAYGSTDEYGYHAIENKLEMHDMHATMLHLLGIDHTQLTNRFGGRDMRLTDVYGNVIHDIIA